MFALPLALTLIWFCLFVFRNFEETNAWIRFRLSSFAWVGLSAMIAAGFINMLELLPLLVVWIGVSGYMAVQIARKLNTLPWQMAGWIALVFLPLSGWILYFSRFPYFHGVDAAAARVA